MQTERQWVSSYYVLFKSKSSNFPIKPDRINADAGAGDRQSGSDNGHGKARSIQTGQTEQLTVIATPVYSHTNWSLVSTVSLNGAQVASQTL